MKTSKLILGTAGALFILVASQTLAEIIASLLVTVGIPVFACNALAGLMYLAAAFFILECFAEKLLKCGLDELSIPKIKISPKYIITAFALPAFVTCAYLLLPGEMKNSEMSSGKLAETLCSGVFFYGLAAGVVEEMVFRGFIMNLIDKKSGKIPAIIIPSVLFGAVHIIGMEYNLLSCIQVIIAGSAVGIMFSFIAMESGSVWNSAVVHVIWNISIIGGIISVGTELKEDSVYSYVLNTDNFALTGGEFGIESSVIAAAAYLTVCAVVLYMMKKKEIITKI